MRYVGRHRTTSVFHARRSSIFSFRSDGITILLFVELMNSAITYDSDGLTPWPFLLSTERLVSHWMYSPSLFSRTTSLPTQSNQVETHVSMSLSLNDGRSTDAFTNGFPVGGTWL